MGKNKSLVLVAVYPGSEKFFHDYFKSIENQSCQDFDLLILNDGLKALPGINQKHSKVIDITADLTIAEIRMNGIQYAIEENYNNLIFSDIDDYYSTNRIEESVADLLGNDFVYNSIIPVDMNCNPLGNRDNMNINYPEQITSYKNILDFNLFGMSNSSIKIDKLSGTYIPKDIIAVDWWLFTIQLLTNSRGKNNKNAITYYRQSEDNLVGPKKSLTMARLDFGLKVKNIHYKHVHNYCMENDLALAFSDYSRKISEMDELVLALENVKFKQYYIEVINRNIDSIYKGWWSEILALDSWSEYE